jgi:hypothetical protein
MVIVSPNNPPDKPNTPTGNINGKIGNTYTYSSSAVDPDGDRLYYMFDWDDGQTSNWDGPYDSGRTISATHIWNEKGTYNVKVKAKDISGAESEWSDPLSISMPKSKTEKSLVRLLDDIWFIRDFFLNFLTKTINTYF